MATFPKKSYDAPVVVNGVLIRRDPVQAESLMTQVAATATVTITGTETDGDVLTLTLTGQQLPDGTYDIVHTTSGSESLTSIAAALKTAINADPLLDALGITADSTGAILTITWIAGPLGNFATLNFHNAGAPIVTLTGTLTTGDYVNVRVTNPLLPGGKHDVQYHVVSGDNSLTALATHVKNAINADTTLAAAGIGATSSLGVVTLTFPNNIGNVTVSCNTNGAIICTVTGTATNGEIPVITITDASLAGSPLAISYTEVVPTDDNTAIATGLKNAINANSACAAAGITATSSTNALTITSTSKTVTTYARTSTAHTTLTLTGGPTETATASGNETEGSTEVQFTGGSGYIVPQQDATIALAGIMLRLFYGEPRLVDYTQLKAILAAGVTVK